MSEVVRVQRNGGRGHHLIDKAKYDANPGAFVLVDESGKAAKPAGNQDNDLASKTVAELKEIAAERKIDLGEATKKADIIAAIEAAKPAGNQE